MNIKGIKEKWVQFLKYLKPWHVIIKPGASKVATQFILCWHLLLGIKSTLKSSLFPSKIPLKKTKYLFSSGYQVESASGLGMGAFAHFSFKLWDPIWCRRVQVLIMLPQSLWVHMCLLPVVWEGLVFLVCSTLSTSYTASSSSSFYRVSWTLKRGI